MATRTSLTLLAHPAGYLRPREVSQRAALQEERVVVRRSPQSTRCLLAGPDSASAADWPVDFRPLDRRVWGDWPGHPDTTAAKATALTARGPA